MRTYFDFLIFRKKSFKKWRKKPKDKAFLIGSKGVAFSPLYYHKEDIFIVNSFTKKIVDTLKGY